MKKLFLLLLVILSWNSFSQLGGPPPPPALVPVERLDLDNDGYVTFNISEYIISLKSNYLQMGNDFSGYDFQLHALQANYTSIPITTATYTNTIANSQMCDITITYNGNGPQLLDQIVFSASNTSHILRTINYYGDNDNDSVINGLEDLNGNLNPRDDNSDGVGHPNYLDNDDDNDGILTINEDYNGNGSVLDDDMNGNGIPDYLDTLARGTLTVNLKLFIEGYYVGLGMMRSVQFYQDGISSVTDVENITVELHNATAPFGFVTSATAMLKTNGTVTCSFPTVSVGSYFIVVKSGNGIPTWSFNPQSLSTTPLTYDFSNAANKAFGNNMKNLGSGVFGLYSGDINQDEFIDASDYSQWETDSNAFTFGIKVTDCNGDGIVDSADYSVWEGNNNNFITVIKPE